jgi:hypothetical protein
MTAATMAGVQHAEIIDMVALDRAGEYVLIMVEDRPWTGAAAQVHQLRDKINTYALFALDGGMVSRYPDSEGKPVRIQLECRTAPTGAIARLIDLATLRLAEYRVEFVVSVAD